MMMKRKGVDEEWDKKMEIRRLPLLLGLEPALPKDKRGKLLAANKYWGGELNLGEIISREEAMEFLYACPFKLGPDWVEVKHIQDESEKRIEEKKREEQLQKEKEEAEQSARLPKRTVSAAPLVEDSVALEPKLEDEPSGRRRSFLKQKSLLTDLRLRERLMSGRTGEEWEVPKPEPEEASSRGSSFMLNA